jgi:hypothetical protein
LTNSIKEKTGAVDVPWNEVHPPMTFETPPQQFLSSLRLAAFREFAHLPFLPAPEVQKRLLPDNPAYHLISAKPQVIYAIDPECSL